MENNVILSIDCGTQSLRAVLFSRQGAILAKVQISYPPYNSPHPGWAEQDPELYWDTLVAACRQLGTETPQYFGAVKGVGITTQRDSMINLDSGGNVLRPAILWLDQRKSTPDWGQKGMLNTLLGLVNMQQKIKDIQSRGKCNWIRQNQPDIWEKTGKYLQVSGFLNYRLTGEFKDSVASQIGYIPFDYRKQAWAGSYQLSRKLFPVETDKLPELVQPGDVLGVITQKAALATGIIKGTPVIACGSDKGCETLGAGVINQDMASLSFGTIATVQTVSSTYIELIKHLPSYPACIPDLFNPGVEIFRGFWMITWFKNEFAHKEIALAEKMGVTPEEVLNQSLERTAPGAMGLVVQPLWGPGLDYTDAKGAMIGFGDVHTKDHIYRAVIEGLGFALYDGLEKIQSKTSIPVQKAVVSGGAAQSDEICRITADIFNIPMIKGQTHETAALGAAILTATGLGWFSDCRQAVDHMVHIKKVFRPDPDHAEIYRQLYANVYSKMYKALLPLYLQIKNITGYPPA